MTEIIRVLVVDDSPFMRGSLKHKIENDKRFTVVDTAANGAEGVEKALSIKPDVVTLDVEMPVLDGIEALKRIVSLSSIPVVMVSSQTDAGAKTTITALEIGAVDFIPKARGAEQIHDKLLAAIAARRGRHAVRPGMGGDADSAARPAPYPTHRLRYTAEVVVIGSSTGGPVALQRVLGGLPKGFPAPIVVAQHMPPQFTLALAKRLNETCALDIVEAHDGQSLRAGTVYIAPGGTQMRVTSDGLKVSPDNGENAYKPCVDVLAESAHTTFGRHVLGVMLTGMGQDGTKEFVRLRKAGAYILAQDQASCVVYGMPRALCEAGGADEVLPLDRIGQRIRMLFGL